MTELTKFICSSEDADSRYVDKLVPTRYSMTRYPMGPSWKNRYGSGIWKISWFACSQTYRCVAASAGVMSSPNLMIVVSEKRTSLVPAKQLFLQKEASSSSLGKSDTMILMAGRDV